MSTMKRPPAPPKPVAPQPTEAAPLAGLAPTVVDTPEGPKTALVVENTAPLPPPGDARREELDRRSEDLAARLEHIEKSLGLDSTGPTRPLAEQEVDRDIARVYDHTAVINPVPGRVYYWANEQSAHGIDVTLHKTDGYKVVCGDDPENPEDKDVRGYRRIGDVILMWIPVDRYEALMARREQARRALKGSVDAGLMQLHEAAQRRGQGVRIRELDSFMIQRAEKLAVAERTASAITDARLRQGRVPGLGLRAR